MIEISLFDLIGRAVNAAITLYMMLILVRWLAPYLQIDMDTPRTRWITRLTEPLIRSMRIVARDRLKLPSFGSLDYGPMLALVAAWLARTILVAVLARAAVSG